MNYQVRDKTMQNTRLKILLIEDDKLDQMAFRRLVKEQELPYDYTVAGSVAEALEVLLSAEFYVIISDYSLGDGTAFDVFDYVGDASVILVTGAGDEEIAVKAWKAGAEDYLIKDIERNYLKTLSITVENVVKHKQMEAKLQLLSGAVMSTGDSVHITDMEGGIVFVNKAFCQTYGYEEKDVVGKGSDIIWIKKSEGKGTRSVFQSSRSGCGVGFYHKKKDGSIFPVSLSRAIVKDGKGKDMAVVAVVRDISEQVTMEEELRTANLKLKERNQEKDELIAGVSEKLKTSLDAIGNIISNARSEQTEAISMQLEQSLLEHINDAATIVDEFHDISGIDADKLKLARSE